MLKKLKNIFQFANILGWVIDRMIFDTEMTITRPDGTQIRYRQRTRKDQGKGE